MRYRRCRRSAAVMAGWVWASTERPATLTNATAIMLYGNRFIRTLRRLERPTAAASSTASGKTSTSSSEPRPARAAGRRGQRHARDGRQMRHAAREMAHAEIHHAGAHVPLRGLCVDPFERAGELLLDTKGHRVRQVLIEQLGMADDDPLQVLGLDAPQELSESQHLLEDPRSGLGPGRHDLREDYENDRGHHGGDHKGHRSQEECRGHESAADADQYGESDATSHPRLLDLVGPVLIEPAAR